jgi:sugar/nucleoside kinase (ribokinase family)
MSNLSILRNSLKLNADVITLLHCAIKELKNEAKAWREQGETAYFVAACADRLKHEAKLASAVAMQDQMKEEIATIFRKERIRVKYKRVFGKWPETQQTTTREQEAMLDALLAEQEAELALAFAAPGVV